MHAIVLMQGLKRAALPAQLNGLVERQYRHFLGGTHGTVDISLLRVEPSIAPTVAFALSSVLLPERYYARINDRSRMYVSFPNSVVCVLKSKPQTAVVARRIGEIYNVNQEHMRFEEMFEFDHPEMHDSLNDRA